MDSPDLQTSCPYPVQNVAGIDALIILRCMMLQKADTTLEKAWFLDQLHTYYTVMLQDVIGKTFRLLGYTIQYGCIAHCVFEYLGGIVMCTGPSMEPTIQNSDIVFSENLSSHFYRIQKGDIVIAKNPADPKTNICKRVMGMEGEKVCTSNPSDFIKTHSYVPKGHVWLEGDNLRNSTDSRCYGPVPYGLIRGRICFKLWPLTDFGFLRSSPNSHRICKG